MADPSSITSSTPSTADASAALSTQHQDRPSLPPLVTSGPSTFKHSLSHASKNRISQYSTNSIPSRSRPPSHMPSIFAHSLPYTSIRDFAYPLSHPMHHGPPPEPSRPPSGWTTPASEQRRLSDHPGLWDQRMPWDSWAVAGYNKGHDLPPIHCGDGPPYSEDDDLHSPVVAPRHRKNKSTSSACDSSRGRSRREDGSQPSNLIDPSKYDSERGYYVDTGGDGSERYYISQGGEANGPGGELVTYPPEEARHCKECPYPGGHNPQSGRSDEGCRLEYDRSSSPPSPEADDEDESRYSRDYQFTITSPDEEFHGKAVALFDFERENENELPLMEGQIIWVSYRHGQGWLVAEDPKTQESGLVPEEYVRLLRDIEGGMSSLTGQAGDGIASPKDSGTPIQADNGGQEGSSPLCATASNGYHQPVVSTFSTSSKDLDPYPTEQLGIQAGQTPPQVVHYHGQRGGSQANTPTVGQPLETGVLGPPTEKEAGSTGGAGTEASDRHGR